MKALLSLYKKSYQKKYLYFSLLAILFMIIDIMISLLVPYFSKKILDEAIPNEDLSEVIRIGTIVIGIALAAVLSTFFNNITAQYVSTALTADIREELFAKIQTLSFTNVDNITTGKLMTVVSNDTSQIQQILMMSFRAILRAPFTLIGAMAMAYITNADLFMVILICVPILAIGFVWIFKKASPKFSQMQTKLDNLNTKLAETIEGAREIKAFVTELIEQDQFEEVNEDYQKAVISANKIIVLVNPLVSLISNVAIGSVVYLAAYIMSKGNNTTMAGTIVTYIAYIQQIIVALTMLSTISIMISRAIVSAERIHSVMSYNVDIENETTPITTDIKGAIEYRNVKFSYADEDGEAEGITLNNINLKINQGETIGIIGSTGSGKTTLVQLIPRMYDTTEGEVFIDGVNIKHFDLKHLREQISFVTQEAIIFEGTIASNIRQGKNDATDFEMAEAAKMAVANEFIDVSKDQYETEITQGGTNLSGGQRQRLSIARALIRKPRILILDDSTSALDAKTEALLKQNLKKITNATVLIVAQKISSIIDCDRIIVLNNSGEVDGFDNHSNLLNKSKVYYEIYQSQFGGDTNEC